MNKYRYKTSLFKPRNRQSKKTDTQKTTGLAVLLIAVGKLFRGAALVLGSIMLFFVLLGVVIGALAPGEKTKSLPGEMIVHLNLDFTVAEAPVKPSLTNPFPNYTPDMKSFVMGLDAVAHDPRVKALVVSLHGVGLNLTQVEELRNAVKLIREKGKRTYIIAADYGVGGGGLAEYYLASAFDEVWLHPVGVLSVPGLSAESPYLGELLEKMGIEPQFFQRKEFKTAFENLTSEEMSDENRRVLNSVLTDIGDRIVKRIAADRNVSEQEIKASIDKALITGPEARQSGLIDTLGFGDALITELDMKEGPLERVSFVNYVSDNEENRKFFKPKASVAYVRVLGAMSLVENTDPFADEEERLRSGSGIAESIFRAAEDPEIKAIILRIDSPGGTPSAAELIRHAVAKAIEYKKPVIVSMSTTAASGGYWAAAGASKIFALPSTLTGSIGVVGGKVSAQELLSKVHVNWESVRYGNNAGLWSLAQPFNEEQAKQFNKMLDVTYANFITRVAQGRGLTLDEAENVARGRVWTGRQALERNLVDRIGGLREAMDETAHEIGLNSRADIALIDYPRTKRPLEKIMSVFDSEAASQARLNRLISKAEVFMNSFGLGEEGRSYQTYQPLTVQ